MIIGMSAKLHCGKTTLANMFMNTHPEYTRLAFGDLLKQECSEIYHYPLEWNYSEEGKQKIVKHSDLSNLPWNGMCVRNILQWHGTEFRREQDPDYWVKRMEARILLIPLSAPEWRNFAWNIMIDDVRFKNEAAFIKNAGGLLIRIQTYFDWKPGKFADHISETDLDDYIDWDIILAPEFGKLGICLPLIEKFLQNKEEEKHE